MPNIRLVLEYVGRAYHGWQRQPGLPTLQGFLEACLSKISGEATSVIGAGRTDAGVHALGQVANFRSPAKLSARDWKNALNALLPADITVLEARQVPDRFHARRAARSKTYEYRILNRPTPSAFLQPFAWHVPHPLRLGPMRQAAKYLIGLHDFSAFCAKAHRAPQTLARLSSLRVKRQKDLVFITVTGTNFLQHMVRNIVGTLVEVGSAKRKAAEVRGILGGRDRRLAGRTAPPQGLFLVRVRY